MSPFGQIIDGLTQDGKSNGPAVHPVRLTLADGRRYLAIPVEDCRDLALALKRLTIAAYEREALGIEQPATPQVEEDCGAVGRLMRLLLAGARG